MSRFERVGMPRSSLDGVVGMTPGYRVRQVHGTERVRVEVVEDERAMLGTALARLCDLWGFEVVPLAADMFEVVESETS